MFIIHCFMYLQARLSLICTAQVCVENLICSSAVVKLAPAQKDGSETLIDLLEAISKTGNGEWRNGNGERGTGNGESLKYGISKRGNL